MPEYIYVREFGDTIHSNPNTYNIDHNYEPINLSERIADALPGIHFTKKLNGTECKIITQETLTGEQETALTNVIATHKAVEDWPFPLATAKTLKVAEIDARTAELIMSGFTYDGSNFSMSESAQRNWIGIGTALSLGMLSFPMIISTVDEGTHELSDSTDCQLFLVAFLTYQSNPAMPLGQGRILKAQVQACTTVAEVEAIVDPR